MLAVLNFATGVILLIILGVGISILFVLIVLSTNDYFWRGNFDQNVWMAIYYLFGYFFILFVAAHGFIFQRYSSGKKIKKVDSQTLEYAYLILTVVGLLSITDFVQTALNARIERLEQRASENFAFFRQTARDALVECERAGLQTPSPDLWPQACKWVSDADLLGEHAFSKQSWKRLENEQKNIKQKWDSFWINIRNTSGIDPITARDPLTLSKGDGVHFSMLAAINGISEFIIGYISRKEDAQKLREYKLPGFVRGLKAFAPVILVFALVLRLSRATLEAAGMVEKE